MWGALLTRSSAPRMKLRLQEPCDALLRAGKLCVYSCLLHSREGPPSLGAGAGVPGQCGSWGPAGSKRVPRGRMLSGYLGEPGWVECP